MVTLTDAAATRATELAHARGVSEPLNPMVVVDTNSWFVADLGLGTVDASIIAVAERMNITTIATMNRRDFLVVKPAHTIAFEIVP